MAASAYFIGAPQRDLLPAVRAANSPYQWNHARHALGVPAQFAGEIEARLTDAGYTVTGAHQLLPLLGDV